MGKTRHGSALFSSRPDFLLLCCLVLCGFLFGFLPEARGAGLKDLHLAYTHSSKDEPLPALLSDFAINQGYSASFTPGVQGLVNGEFVDMPPDRFLAGIRAGFGVEAYILGSTLHFFNQSERRREVLRITSMLPREMRAALLRMGALSEDLPSDTSKRERLLFLEGPDNYVAGIVSSIRALEEAQLNEQAMRVFPLKHAWADDTSIESATGSTLLPGVASVLRAIATGQPSPAARSLLRSDSGQPLMGSGLIGRRASAGSSSSSSSSSSGSGDSSSQEKQSGANIIAEPRSNSIIVTDKLYRMPYYETVIAELDKPSDLVEIHAAIVDINANYARDLGVNWGGARLGGDLGGSSAALGSPSSAIGGPDNSGFTVTTLLSSRLSNFFSNIRILEEKGEGAVLSRPSVLTMDNVQATLEYTSTFYIKLQGNESVDLVPVTAGTVLKVTPRILRMPDGRPSRLAMSIVISDGSDPVDSDKATWVDDIPAVKKVTINTQALVAEGQSLLLGGFYYEQRSGGDSGAPGLMEIPALGSLFKRSSQNVQRIERLIIISPRIIAYESLDASPPERVLEQGFALNPTKPGYDLERNFHEVEPSGSGCSGTVRPRPEAPAARSSPEPE
ncbi:MAG: type III secretion system outer membrane ring subunit SctC [Deltaproteobacteria bacterium]|jgi:type III secretion protein C|nr:type III secretion system outer membrane ring subunit SctC [Deltaproteobacteria bacterium]